MLVLFTILVPQSVVYMPTYLMYRDFDPLGIDVYKRQMLEAARIDGASEYRICFGVVLPNVKPALLTVILFVFQSAWNNRGQTFIFDEELKLLPVAVSDIVASNGIAYMGMGSAATVLLMLPPIILFILTQRRIVETMAFAGLKD